MRVPHSRLASLVAILISVLFLATCAPPAAPEPLPPTQPPMATPGGVATGAALPTTQPSPTPLPPEPTATTAPLPTATAPANSLPAATQAAQGNRPAQPLTPVIVFAGWFANRLAVEVNDQTVAPDCPKSVTFEVPGRNLQTAFSQVCQDKLLTLVYDPDPSKPMPLRFSDQPGVKVTLADYGKTASTPVYEPMYTYLERAGYTRDVNIRVAGYDSRLAPDQGGFLDRTVGLIEETYRANGNTPVHLLGHSSGPVYAQYLLTHTSRAWKDKYLHGFTTLSGDFPGQGSSYSWLFTGFNLRTGSFPGTPANAASSAAMYQSFPGGYITTADPAYFGDREVVIRTVKGGKAYTPADYWQLFGDAGLPAVQEIARYYIGFVKFEPPNFPYVDVYAETGSGFDTEVGLELQDLTTGQVRAPDAQVITRDGDLNQEDLTNDSVKAWAAMPCYHFEFRVNPSLNHFDMPNDPGVLNRLLLHLKQPKSQCPLE